MGPGDSDIRNIKGVGEQRAQAFSRLGIFTLYDLMTFFPRDYLDLGSMPPLDKAHHGDRTFLIGEIVSKVQVTRPRSRFSVAKATVECGDRRVQCVWYNRPYLKNTLRMNSRWLLIGSLETQYGSYTILNPIMEKAEADKLPAILPIYRLTKNLSQKVVRSLIYRILNDKAGSMPESLPVDFRKRYGLAERNYALENIHFPASMDALKRARERLSFEEILFFLTALRTVREKRISQPGIAMSVPQEVMDRFLAMLPYHLTNAQEKVLGEIRKDMATPFTMNRLIQGDVGSGKTVLAMAALYIAVCSGMQGALMAPTELLADQHERNARAILEPLGVRVGMLKGSMTAKCRREALAAIKNKDWDVIIGTHALIQPDVEYQRLGIVVTDEQHRFGVRQRAVFGQKREGCDMLVMSATPIPRTLSLILYGDLDISLVNELPPGRKPIITRLVPPNKRSDMYRYIGREIMNSQQAYIVCPLVEDSDKLESLSATGLYEGLVKTEFENVPVGLVHGRMAAADKEDVLSRFRSGELRAIVATTVVEVGVDVPAATIMVVENADRFGLAQLHQLRGRVGRGSAQSWCFLSSGDAGKEAMKRLKVMTSTQDGFVIAEKDLELRGPGEFLGQQQAGMADPKILALLGDIKALKKVRDAVDALFGPDADSSEREAIINQAMTIYDDRLSDIVFN